MKIDRRYLDALKAGRNPEAEAADGMLRRLGPKSRASADRIRPGGFVGSADSRVQSLTRWAAAWCHAGRRPLITAYLKPGSGYGSVTVVTVHCKGLDPATSSGVLALMRAAVYHPKGKAGATPYGFVAYGIPAGRVDAVAAEIANQLCTPPPTPD